MEHVLVEKLVNLRHYPVSLHFELPVDLSMASQPEIKTVVKGVRQLLRQEGLLLQGTLTQTVSDRTVKKPREREEELHFTYLIPREDLQEPNLLNFEVQVSVEQSNHHLLRKRGQVFISETLELLIILHEYHLEDSSLYRLGGMQKQTGIFLKQLGEVEERLFKLEPIQLPGDFSLLIKISGTVDGIKTDMTDDGCILEFACHMQGEYVTVEQKVSTFFFQKNECVYFPMQQEWYSPSCRVKPVITFADLTLEGREGVAMLYRIMLQFFQEREVNFYTGNPAEMPAGVEMKRIEVEQIGRRVTTSQIVEEQVDLDQLHVEQLTGVLGECKLHVEESREQVLVSGEVDWNCTYLGEDGRERVHHWKRRVDQMLVAGPGEGKWQVTARVRVADWEFKGGVLRFAGLIDYTGLQRQKRLLAVLCSVPAELQEVSTESFLVTEEIDAGQIAFPGEEKVYLQRYATMIRQIDGQVTHLESRPVEGGWMVKGQGEFVIYYLAEEGERHCCHPFRFYCYIPHLGRIPGSELRLTTAVRFLDQEMLEDGSALQTRYLLQVRYVHYTEHRLELVTGLGPGPGRVRPVFQVGEVLERVEEEVELVEDWLRLNRITEVLDLQLDWRDYRVFSTGDGFDLEGELEARVRYRNRSGREKRLTVPVPVRIKKTVTVEGVCQGIRAVPLIKGYDYRLTDHPQIALAVSLEIRYRLIGICNTL